MLKNNCLLISTLVYQLAAINLCCMADNPQVAFNVPVGQRQLFLDDMGIAQLDNLKRTMHQPDKKGAVIRCDPDRSGPDQYVIQIHTPPIWDPNERIWKCWTTTPRSVGGYWEASAYWESQDGLHWTKPNLGQFEFEGSKANNYISFEFQEKRYGPHCVVYDPTDPDPQRRYKSALPPFCMAVSPDGRRWKGLDIHVQNRDTYTFSFDQSRHLFIVASRKGHWSDRKVILSTSQDFENWDFHGLILEADQRDMEIGLKKIEERFKDPTLKDPEYNRPQDYNSQVYRMGVFGYEGLFIGLPMMYYRTAQMPPGWEGFDEMDLPERLRKDTDQGGDATAIFEIQLACSRDLQNWKRLGNRQAFIGPSRVGSGAYDTHCIMNGDYPLVRGDELWFYYSGAKSYAIISERLSDQGAICLAVLRRDGFISLDAGDTEGVLVTEPFVFQGNQLFVNVHARHQGKLIVEALDEDDHMLARSAPTTGDQPRAMIRWEQGDATNLANRTVRLRFRVLNASFYSYWCDRTDSQE